jgi:hypothetical protein
MWQLGEDTVKFQLGDTVKYQVSWWELVSGESVHQFAEKYPKGALWNCGEISNENWWPITVGVYRPNWCPLWFVLFEDLSHYKLANLWIVSVVTVESCTSKGVMESMWQTNEWNFVLPVLSPIWISCGRRGYCVKDPGISDWGATLMWGATLKERWPLGLCLYCPARTVPDNTTDQAVLYSIADSDGRQADCTSRSRKVSHGVRISWDKIVQ